MERFNDIFQIGGKKAQVDKKLEDLLAFLQQHQDRAGFLNIYNKSICHLIITIYK